MASVWLQMSVSSDRGPPSAETSTAARNRRRQKKKEKKKYGKRWKGKKSKLCRHHDFIFLHQKKMAGTQSEMFLFFLNGGPFALSQ
uniref:Uncharacterized protein n=1 Tax=Anguilla anguilla TaxID=7936 RepID=A0A0E9WXQ5_ANGAN